MKKTVRLSESDLNRLVKKIIEEQTTSAEEIPKDHPINNKLWKELDNWMNGDGPHTIKYIPNKMLVLGGDSSNRPYYTITKHM